MISPVPRHQPHTAERVVQSDLDAIRAQRRVGGNGEGIAIDDYLTRPPRRRRPRVGRRLVVGLPPQEVAIGSVERVAQQMGEDLVALRGSPV